MKDTIKNIIKSYRMPMDCNRGVVSANIVNLPSNIILGITIILVLVIAIISIIA